MSDKKSELGGCPLPWCPGSSMGAALAISEYATADLKPLPEPPPTFKAICVYCGLESPAYTSREELFSVWNREES